MTDSRTTPANGRVAHVSLRGKVKAKRFARGERRQVGVSLAPLWRDAGEDALLRQLLFGDSFNVLDSERDHVFGQCEKDGHVGYVRASELCAAGEVSHRVTALSSHLYSLADIKSPPVCSLPLGGRLEIVGRRNGFAKTGDGHFVPEQHIRRIDRPGCGPADIAEMFEDVPYLWGVDSCWGIDCSGLVQVALLSCGIACPRDSDMQEESVGTQQPENGGFVRGDLLFWSGHVAMVLDARTLIHASATHMAVVKEPIAAARERIRVSSGEMRVIRRL